MSDTQKDFYKKLLGRKGENAVCKYLKKRGYKLIKRNYVTPFGEADIIAEKEGETVFVEVKTRSGNAFGDPKDAVDFKKREKYRRIAEYYMNAYCVEEISFAVAEVDAGGGVIFIDHAF